MDDDDKFVARRGSQGDDWHWEAPDSDFRDSRLARSSGAKRRFAFVSQIRDALRRPSAWFGAAFAMVGSSAGRLRAWLSRPYERPPQPPAPPSPDVPPPETTAALPPLRPKTAVPWSRIALPRPKLPRNRPQLTMPRAPWSRPAIKRPTLSRPGVWSLNKEAQESLALFAGLALATVVAVGAILIAVALNNDDNADGVVNGETATPRPTLIPPVSQTPFPTEVPSGSATPSPSPSPSPTPSPTPTPGITPSAPHGQPAVAFWANRANAWWFGDLTGDVAQYEEGQFVPFMVRWDPVAGQTFDLTLTYDCKTNDAFAAIDYLSGIDSFGTAPVFAEYGPARDRPEAALPVPDTAEFPPDDNDFGVFTLYGGKFATLPTGPEPGDTCEGQRTIGLRVQATGAPLILLGSGHLATASVYGSGEAASSNDPAFGLRVTLAGVGGTSVMIDASAVADVEH